MITILLLTMLLAGCFQAQGAPDEGHEHPWSQPLDECMAAAEQLENSTSFGIEVEDGWVQEEVGGLISIYPPHGNGVLKIQSYRAPSVVDKEALRNLTNVDLATSLTWQDWGDFSGYQYDYPEGGSFFRQWWLVNQRTLIFVVYESSVEPEVADTDEIDRIVSSMTANET